jgi:hypothetical protein
MSYQAQHLKPHFSMVLRNQIILIFNDINIKIVSKDSSKIEYQHQSLLTRNIFYQKSLSNQ